MFLDAHGTLNNLAFLGAGLGVVVVGVSEDHGVSTDHLKRFVVSSVDNALLGGGTGHDGARSLLERSGELHDLGVPFLVRDVSLSVLRDSLLGGGCIMATGKDSSQHCNGSHLFGSWALYGRGRADFFWGGTHYCASTSSNSRVRR